MLSGFNTDFKKKLLSLSGDADEPRFVTTPEVLTSDQTSISLSWSLDKDNTAMIIELYPDDAGPITVSNTNQTHIQNLLPGTNYEIHLKPSTQNGIFGDTQIIFFHTKLTKPEIVITEHSADSIGGFVHIQGRYDTVEVFIEPQPIKFSSSFFDLTGSEQLNWRFDNLLSGHKYVVTAVVKLIKINETETNSAQIELPCTPMFVKRQIILDNGYVLMTLKVDDHGDKFVYNVITKQPGVYADSFPVQKEVRLRFPPALIGELLDTNMTGFLKCNPSQNVIAVGKITNVRILARLTTLFLAFEYTGLLDDDVLVHVDPEPQTGGQSRFCPLDAECEIRDVRINSKF